MNEVKPADVELAVREFRMSENPWNGMIGVFESSTFVQLLDTSNRTTRERVQIQLPASASTAAPRCGGLTNRANAQRSWRAGDIDEGSTLSFLFWRQQQSTNLRR